MCKGQCKGLVSLRRMCRLAFPCETAWVHAMQFFDRFDPWVLGGMAVAYRDNDLICVSTQLRRYMQSERRRCIEDGISWLAFC